RHLHRVGKFQATPTIPHAIHLDCAHVLAPCFDTNSTSTQEHDWLQPIQMLLRQDYAYVAWLMSHHALSLLAQILLKFQFASSTTSHVPFFPNHLSLLREHSPLRQYGRAHHAKYSLEQKVVTVLQILAQLLCLDSAKMPMNPLHHLIAQ